MSCKLTRSLMLSLAGALLLASGSPAVSAQGGLIPFRWDVADLSLGYPGGWREPVASVAGGRLVLRVEGVALAADNPFIELILLVEDAATGDLSTLIEPALQSIELVVADAQQAARLAGQDGVAVAAASTDGSFSGAARAAQLPDGRMLLAIGRWPSPQQLAMQQVFTQVAESIAVGVAVAPSLPAYGVQWQTSRIAADVESLVDLSALSDSVAAVGYAVDARRGVVQFDSATGEIQAIFPNALIALPTDLAVSPDGSVFVADLACSCLLILEANGAWAAPISGFGSGAPRSIAISADGTLYATTQAGAVRVFADSGERLIELGAEISGQPLLAIAPDGRLLAYSSDGQLWELIGTGFSPRFTFTEAQAPVTDIAVDVFGNLVLATSDRGILLVGADGEPIERLGRIVPGFPLPGELVSPASVGVGADGTLYWVDSDGAFGAITALSTAAGRERVGNRHLVFGQIVEGALNESASQQIWTFAALAGQRATVFAVAEEARRLDVALRLLAPDGAEVAFNDTQAGAQFLGPFDALLNAQTLPSDGTYIIRVERQGGSGVYRLGLAEERRLLFDAAGVAAAQGQIRELFPVERWLFQGRVGQVVNVTMQAQDPTTLDPIVRLFGPDGALLAENDDAADFAFGTDSQLVQVQLPADGLYTVEAARFEGSGPYRLVLVATS